MLTFREPLLVSSAIRKIGGLQLAPALRAARPFLRFIKENTNAYVQIPANWAVGCIVRACTSNDCNSSAKHRKSQANEGIRRGSEHAAGAPDRQECRRHPRKPEAHQAAARVQD